MPNKNGCYDLLDHLYRMQRDLESPTWNRHNDHSLNRLIDAAFELTELSAGEIDPSSIALQLGHLFYGVQVPHSELNFRFMPEDEIQPRIQTIASTLASWIGLYESRVRVVTELPAPTHQYTEADTKWINSSHPLYASLPEILTREGWRQTKPMYLVIPGLLALHHGKSGAHLSELISGIGYAMNGRSAITVTKDNCKAFIVALANQVDWSTYIKDLLDQDNIYVRANIRSAAASLWAYDSANKLLGLDK